MPERRQEERLPFDTRLMLVISDTGRMLTVRGLDVSGSGLGVITRSLVEPGTICSLRFRLPGASTGRAAIIEPSAEVVRAQPTDDGHYLLGISFAYMPPEQSAALREYIDAWLEETQGARLARA